MTSYSTRLGDMRSKTRSTTGAMLMAAAAWGVSAGCTQIRTEETSVEFVRSRDAPSCLSTTSSGHGPARSMDTYVVQVFELTDQANQQQSACDNCLATGAGCFLEKTNCFCGGPTAPDPALLPGELTGMRVQVHDYESLYCTRVLAVDRSALGESTTRSCTCQDAWTTPAFLTEKARLCALSSPYATSPLRVELPVQCPVDGRSFSTCIGI
jgi:hypothetical protein